MPSSRTDRRSPRPSAPIRTLSRMRGDEDRRRVRGVSGLCSKFDPAVRDGAAKFGAKRLELAPPRLDLTLACQSLAPV